MPITKQALKRMRADSKRRIRNLQAKSELKTLSKKVQEMLSAKDAGKARDEAQLLIKKLSKAASKGIIHKKTASRKISRLMKRFSKTQSG